MVIIKAWRKSVKTESEVIKLCRNGANIQINMFIRILEHRDNKMVAQQTTLKIA